MPSPPNPSLAEAIRRELPALIRSDPELRDFILTLARQEFAPRQETESRFDRVLDELRRQREESTQKWEENNRKWEESTRRLDQFQIEQARKWDEQAAKWDAQEAKWEENNRQFERVHNEIMAIAMRQDNTEAALARHREETDRDFRELRRTLQSTVGALGARWGLSSEHAFRSGLAAILEGSFGVQVLNVNEFDDEGSVFGRPDQVELDVIIRNGTLILCELKSNVDRGAVYLFERKVRFYERRHGRKANRILIVSPMIDERARKLAETLGIETYGLPEEVPVKAATPSLD